MNKNNETIQCYIVGEGKLFASQLKRSEMKRFGYTESPIDAIKKAIDSHEHWLNDEELKVKNRKEVISRLKKILNNYYEGENIFGESGINDIYSDIKL